MSESKTEKHPSYGIVRLSQSQGGLHEFFGSPADTKHSYISLQIAPGEVNWDGAYPSYYSSNRGIINIRMTRAQFVNMVTSIGKGEGTPCTIEYRTDVDGTIHRMEDPPKKQSDTDRVHDEFKEKCKRIDRRLDFYRKQIEEILAKKSALTKSDKDTINRAMASISMEIRDSIPYMSNMFSEAAERIVSHAKNEIDAVVNTYIKDVGMKAIKSGLVGLLGTSKKDHINNVVQDMTTENES